jgi:hypothetical protein
MQKGKLLENEGNKGDDTIYIAEKEADNLDLFGLEIRDDPF